MLAAHAGGTHSRCNMPGRTTTAGRNNITGTELQSSAFERRAKSAQEPSLPGGDNEQSADAFPSRRTSAGGVYNKEKAVHGVESQMKGVGTAPVEEKKAARIRAQMSVLMVGFFEIIRQVISKVFLGLDEEWRVRVLAV